MPGFDKWWADLKKHRKRLQHWLPHWRALASRIGNERPIRYFTLCSRSMIDVFMLVVDGMLTLDPDNHSITRVQFCESDQEQFAEIREMIAREDAGFFGKLEDVVLFQDDDFTGQFPTIESISLKLEDEGLQGEIAKLDKLMLKRTHFDVRSSFPFDLINLDFCQYYYPHPPGMLRVNETVARFLDWQRRTSEGDQAVRLNEFILAVTCRHDVDFPPEAEARLTELIRANCNSSQEYKQEVERTRGTGQIDEWKGRDKEDFFFAGWPKDIARAAREHGWSMKVLDYVYYRRNDDVGNPYVIACLVAQFSRSNLVPDYIPTALFALNQGNRKLIPEIDRASVEGQQLLSNLKTIVIARNQQAQRKRRPELPDP